MGSTLVLKVDEFSGNWIVPPEYPRYCGFRAQTGMDIFSPVSWKRETEMARAFEKNLQEWSKHSQQPDAKASTSGRVNSFTPSTSSSLSADPTHGIPRDTKSPRSNHSRAIGDAIIANSAGDSKDMAGPGRQQQQKATIEAPPNSCDDDTTEPNIPETSNDVCESPEQEDAKSSCSFADVCVAAKEIRPAHYMDSTLFSSGEITTSSENVTFPKRKNRADRNVWRDWTNSGYADLIDTYDEDATTTPTTNSDVTSPTSCTAAVSSSRASADEGSAERLCGGNTEESSESSSEEFLASRCDPSGTLQPLSESKAMDDEVDCSRVSGKAWRSSKCAERQGRGDTQKVSSRFRGVWCKQRSFNQNCTAGRFPPPLESLSRHKTQRCANQMPWVQLQHIRSQGRFMLQEVEVTQPVVFQPIRKDGRLVLHLVNQSDEVEDSKLVTPDNCSVASPAAEGTSSAAISPSINEVEDSKLVTPDNCSVASPAAEGTSSAATSPSINAEDSRKRAATNGEAELDERESDDGKAHGEWRMGDDGEAHQLLENLHLPRISKDKWKRAATIWPEPQADEPSAATATEWVEQTMIGRTTSLASGIHIVDRKRRPSSQTYVQDGQSEATPFLTVYESIIRDSFLTFTTAHSFLKSLSGTMDANFSDFSDFSSNSLGGKTFLCGGMGKDCHRTTFRQQPPCVS